MAGNYRPEIKRHRRGHLAPHAPGALDGRSRRKSAIAISATSSRRKQRHPQPAARGPGRLAAPRPEHAARDRAGDADYRKDSDPLGRFLEACVVSKDGAREQSSALHRLFCAWCRANGEKEWTATGFGKAMAERGFVRRHSDVNWWLNIAMTKTVADFEAGNEPPPHGEPIENTGTHGHEIAGGDPLDGF
jgi:hypothetical protein